MSGGHEACRGSGGTTLELSSTPFPLRPRWDHTHLPFEELLDLRRITLRVRGDVDRLGAQRAHPELHGPSDLLQVRQAHRRGERGGRAAARAHTLRGGHEVRAHRPVLQHGTGVLLWGCGGTGFKTAAGLGPQKQEPLSGKTYPKAQLCFLQKY